MRIKEQSKLEMLLNMSYEPDETEAIVNAIENAHVDEEEFMDLINNIKNNWRY